MDLSIIIPTLNEEQHLGHLLQILSQGAPHAEIIVVDGGSTDLTREIASGHGVNIITTAASRAKQMNMGAVKAKHDNLYFVHADTLPPVEFLDDIKHSLGKGFHAACYRSKFDTRHPLFRINSFFTRFPWLIARGGDQSLFITKSLLSELGGFDEKWVIMEEYPLIKILLERNKLFIIPKYILISTRKYRNRSWLKVSRANYIVFKMFRNGVDSSLIRKRYLELLN